MAADDPPLSQSETFASEYRPAILWILVPLVLAVTVVAAFVLSSDKWPYAMTWLGLDKVTEAALPKLVALLTAALLALAPLAACFVQTISLTRQLAKLDDIVNPAAKATQYFQLARSNLIAVRPASLTQPGFTGPILLFSAIITFCSLISFMGLYWPNELAKKSFILGGLYVLKNDVSEPDIINYQSGTLVIAGVAFIGAYLTLFKRLLDQLNNNDVYPITFHYHSLWLIGAMMIAAIARHILSLFGMTENAALILIAFAIGAAPSPFVSAFLHWAFNKLNIVGDKDDPARSDLPSNSNLLMIDGLANANIDRLSELDITDAQILSCQNPFTLWVRLPYEFGLIVDWISQAQLYVCVREEGFRAARAQQINNIRKFYAVLSDPLSSPQLCDELKLQRAFVAPLLTSLNDNPSFVRLQEVERAMLGFDETTRQASDPKMAPNPASPAALVAAPLTG